MYWKEKILVLGFVSLCNNWKGAMSFVLILFSSKAKSVLAYFMYDRDNLKNKNTTNYKICL